MTMLYPIVLETEDNGAVSAYVPGLTVYAAADSHAQAERAIRAVLADYLNAHPASRPDRPVKAVCRAVRLRTFDIAAHCLWHDLVWQRFPVIEVVAKNTENVTS